MARLIHYVFSIYELGLFAYVLCSWIPHPSALVLHLRLARWYEPPLLFIRRRVPALGFGYTAMDLSPVVLFVGLSLARSLLLSLFVSPFASS